MSLRSRVPSWMKWPLRDLATRYRKGTARCRVLPDTIIIGAQKSGTSSLYSYMKQHPDLVASYGKEVHYFDGGRDPEVDAYAEGEVGYRAHFPLSWRARVGQRIFEASPLYLFNPLVPRRISELVPEVRLIAILRNPTDRAISHYFHEKRNGRERLSLMEALLAEEDRLRPVLASKNYKSEAYIHFSYKARGVYREQIARYFDYFGSDSMLILKAESLDSDPIGTLRRVFDFLAVDPSFVVPDLRPRNVASDSHRVEPEVHQHLSDYFRPHSRDLYDLLGEDFGW